MAEETITPPVAKERSVPKVTFTDAEAGAKEFPSSRSRSYNYFEPKKRRASVYEDVTVDVQPDPDRHLTQGWVYSFADGSAGYPKDWTALKSTNWHLFLDPNEEWNGTFFPQNSNTVRQIAGTLASAKAAGAYRGWSRSWTKVVERHVSAWAHVEHGLGMHVYTPAQRDAPTNMINNALAVGAMHKLRFAQDIILYNLEVSEEIDGFDGAAHKDAWQNDAEWQGVRKNVEELTAVRDWAEAFFATAVVFEPLVGELFRSAFVMQAAAPQGDFITPSIMGCGESDAAREQRGARALFRMLADDPEHGAANHEVMQGWLAKWIPVSLEAGRRLQPVWSQVSEKLIRFEDSRERSELRMVDLLEDITLDIPKEIRS